ncbi:MAG: copper oxidase [Gammaproteobacteria bacterium]
MRRARLACLCACLTVVLFPACQQAAEEATPAAAAPPPAGQPTPKLRLPEGQHAHHQHEGMDMDLDGAVMNENTEKLPQDCPEIAGEVEITVKTGKKYAREYPGKMFSYDRNEWEAGPCTRVKLTFINEDPVRHQWMVHGLPKYLYPEAMFHIEVTGPAQKTGTFILPSTKRTYFVHCDIAQHMEKGMKAQLKVAGGDGDLPSIPGIVGDPYPDRYEVEEWGWQAALAVGFAGLLGAGLTFWFGRKAGHSSRSEAP